MWPWGTASALEGTRLTMSQMAALTVLHRVLRMFVEPNPSIMLQKRDYSMRPAAPPPIPYG